MQREGWCGLPGAMRWAAATAAAMLLGAWVPGALGAQPARRAHAPAAHALAKTSAAVTLFPDQTAGPPLMGLGVEWDPYDSFQPTWAGWDLIEQRLAVLAPGFIRVVEPASDYFKGYDAAHRPTYKWSSDHVQQLLQILAFAQSHHITVVLGDWGNPALHGDARIPAEFIEQLHDTYGFTVIRYYDPKNEPNYDSGCDFTCWTRLMASLRAEFAQLGMGWIRLVGPSDGNSWDDTGSVRAADARTGLDTDNPANDAWVSAALHAIPGDIGAYDSHRYSTTSGIESGVYEEQMLTRRDEISNLDSPGKPYFEGEVGLTVRATNPFAKALSRRQRRVLPALVDPSARASVSSFRDSQPRITQFSYGAWMGDMVAQAIDGGLSGASAWDLDDAMHAGGGYGSQNLKQWGFWNSFGGQDGYPASDLNLRPWYYAWSVLSRAFPAGARALTVPSTGLAGVHVAAARVPRGGGYALSFALVNENNAARTIKLFVHYVSPGTELAVYDYLASERPADVSGYPVPAQTVSGVDLRGGYTVTLPAQGLVVLTSLGLSSTTVSEGPRTLIDGLGGFGDLYARSKDLRVDRSNPLVFDGDRARATVSEPRPPRPRKHKKHRPKPRPPKVRAGYLIYRAPGITSFELKLYAKAGTSVRVYTSSDGRRWTGVPLASTPPAAALEGQGWYFDELLPRAPLGSADLLKIVLPSSRVELGQVRLQAG